MTSSLTGSADGWTVPHPTAVLVLADGTVIYGQGAGAKGQTVGEVCFNTAMTGYQEILTDPSYKNQMVTLTYPHIGNTGVNTEDEESAGVHVEGLIIREVPRPHSNWRSEGSVSDYLKQHGKLGIAGIDTRRLTRILRDKGAQNGCLMAGQVDEAEALKKAKAFPGLVGADLAQVVTTDKAYDWKESLWIGPDDEAQQADLRYKVVVYDFGVKRNILRELVAVGCELTVVPAQTPASEVIAMKPDGVMLSNGPGDPEPCDYAIKAAAELMAAKVPVMGICLGHQILALASGAKTVKMKFGHHGANHPVQNLDTGEVMISSQNHGFAADEDSLPDHLTATHRSLFDGSLQGIKRTDCPAFSFQGHPEASPGPHDVSPLFKQFIEMMDA